MAQYKEYNCIYKRPCRWYVLSMEFEWDEAKNTSNRNKHGVRFEEAQSIFERSVLMWEDTRRDYGEPRFISVGEIGDSIVVVLAVVHTPRGRTTRIISARKANVRERSLYYAYLEEKTQRDRRDS